MSVCVLLTALNEEGKKSVKKNPERIKEYNKGIESLGVKIVGQYVLDGEYDFLEIFEGLNKEAMCNAALDADSRSTTNTVALMGKTLDEFIATVKEY